MAGGPGESVAQPLWQGDQLSFISDRTDWWNIYTETSPGQVLLCGRRMERLSCFSASLLA